MERGEFVYKVCGGVVATVWRDNKLVYIMATNTSPTDATTCQRKNKDGTVDSIPVPQAISRYNKYMGGVDRADQLHSYYQWDLKSRKYYM